VKVIETDKSILVEISSNHGSELNCAVTSITLTASVSGTASTGATIEWSNGSVDNSITVSTPGRYIVTATNIEDGCTSSAEIIITIGDDPISIPETESDCDDDVARTGHITVINPVADFLYSIDGSDYDPIGNFQNVSEGSYYLYVKSDVNAACTKVSANPIVISCGCITPAPPKLKSRN
jgi:hypothetical protein